MPQLSPDRARICAAGINLWRLFRWRGPDTRSEPLLLMVTLAAAVRISTALAERARADLLLVAAGLWVGAFGLFAPRYAPLMLRPRATE